jgi:hypothetical protein
MSRARAVIGTGGEFAGSAAGINAALAAGRRWLVFTDAQISVDSEVDLNLYNPYGNAVGFLRFEGAPGGTRLVRTGDFRIFKSQSPNYYHQWTVYMTDLQLDAGAAAGTSPLMELQSTDRSHFKRCEWVGSGSDGLILGFPGPGVPNSGFAEVCSVPPGSYQVSTSRFDGCRFANNAGWGLQLRNAIDFTIEAQFEANGSGGVSWQGPPPQDCTGATRYAKGIGSVTGCIMYGNGGPDVLLERVGCVRVGNSQIQGTVRLEADTRWCLVEDTAFIGAVQNFGTANVIR